jgi:M6 family metalloprotease-like protein
MKVIKRSLILVLMVVICATALLARSANPCPIIYTQPDGNQLTVFLKGDEHVRFARTMDGYTILQDQTNRFVYAVKDKQGNLVPSDIQAKDPIDRRLREKRFLIKTGKHQIFSIEQLHAFRGTLRRGIHSSNQIAGAAFPSLGTRKVLVLLIGFQDVPFVLPQSDFDGLMNQTGFNGTGCFKEYHLDNSFGQLTLNSTVMGPYTAINDMSWYGNNRGSWDARPRNMVAEAIDAAEADGLDFSQFDNNGDGVVDGIMVIHAGYDEAAGAPASSIWSHAWDLGNLERNYDGVSISAYITSPELSGISGTNISDIGVLAHEFGHNLGLPDAYDTDYEQGGGYAYGTGYFDIMADGGWNNGGFTPANHIAWNKYMLDWQTPIVLNGMNTTITVPEAGSNNVSYLINTTTQGEYFMLENLQQVGWNEYIEGHGLLIYHIDGPYIDTAGNAVNSNPSHQGIDIEEADGTEDWGPSAAGDPFPGVTNNTSFTDTTTPNSIAWNNAATNVPITNITENAGVITFDVGSGSSGGDSDLYVSDIAMTASKQGKRYYANAAITIFGSPSGNPIADANVSITWSGAVNGTDNGTTDANGTVTFTSAKVSATGPFTITINNVTHATIQYNATLNVETSDTISY